MQTAASTSRPTLEPPLSQRIHKLVSELTQSEKIGLVSGRDMWNNHGVERLGIGA